MTSDDLLHRGNGGTAPATLGFSAVTPEWLACQGTADAAPVIPAAESTLGSHPCVALSSAQVLPEWINHNLAVMDFPSDGDYPLTLCLTPGVHFKKGLRPFSPHPFSRGGGLRRFAPSTWKPIPLDEIDHFTGESYKPASLRSDGDRRG